MMHSDGGIDQITAERAQPRKRPLLVGAGELAVSGTTARTAANFRVYAMSAL
jgi:hypothetical protein